MKNFLLVSIFLILYQVTANLPLTSGSSLQGAFICDSTGGKKYHFKKGCRGLSNCKASIKKLSIGEAKKIGKTLCGWE